MFGNTVSESYAIIVILLTLVSIFSCSFVVGSYFYYRRLRFFHFQLIITVCAFDLLYEFILLIPPSIFLSKLQQGQQKAIPHYLCELEGFFQMFSIQGATIWTCFIFHQLLIKDQQKGLLYKKTYILFGSVLPLILCLIPIAFDGYQHVGLFQNENCFISFQKSSIKIVINFIISLALPLFTEFTFCCWVIFKLFNSKQFRNLQWKDKKRTLILFVYPTIIFLGWVLPTITQIISFNFIIPRWAYETQGLISSVIGLSNSIAFSLTIIFGRFMKNRNNGPDSQNLNDLDDQNLILISQMPSEPMLISKQLTLLTSKTLPKTISNLDKYPTQQSAIRSFEQL